MRAGMAVAAAVMLLSGTAAAQTGYGVFCANGRIEVDGRDLQAMTVARGSGVCGFGSFSTLSSAQDLAQRQFGGVGRPCTCGR